MAEIFPDEWLDHLLGQVPRNDAATFPIPATLHMGLFTGTTGPTVVPTRGLQLGTNGQVAGIWEVNGTGYARVSMAAAVWGTQASITPNGSGRRLTASQQTFPESGGAWNHGTGGTIKGFFIANAALGSAGKAVYYANFDDAQVIDINAAGYTVKVTPFYQLDG